jgi:hypothetical protein
VANCEEWYVVKSGDECGTIATAYNISLAQFYAWNPAVGNESTFSSLLFSSLVKEQGLRTLIIRQLPIP